MFYIETIQLTNFKCYSKQEFTFSPHKNIIVGKNAVGKTSLVEAIYALCFTKSFRPMKDRDLIRKDQDYFHLKAQFVTKKGTQTVNFSYDGNAKRIKKDEKGFPTTSEYLGEYVAVVFSPDDLELVKGSPLVRRRFLDTNIAPMNRRYLQTMISYRRLLKERNEFLKSIEDEKYDQTLLSILTQALIEESQIIIETRNTFIHELNTHIERISMQLSGNREIVQLVYNPHTNVDNLWKTSKDRLSYDLFQKTTTWGPARDNIMVLINGEDASLIGSQGQIRSATLAMKLALAEVFAKKKNEVLIILDDVFSELDDDRQNEVLNLLKQHNQTFITTTSIDALSKNILEDSKIIEIEGGREHGKEKN